MLLRNTTARIGGFSTGLDSRESRPGSKSTDNWDSGAVTLQQDSRNTYWQGFAILWYSEMATAQPRLTAREYEQFRRATATHREELVVRLCGEVGLRAVEVVAVRPSDFTDRQGSDGRFLAVQETDGDTRTAYVPEQVAHDVEQYVRSNDLGDDEPLVDVTPRRVQMLVGEIGARAASETGRAAFDAVTPSTLRRQFGQWLLVEHGVDARVVAAVGGWQGVDDLLRELRSPTQEEIATAFEQLDGGTTDAGRLSRLVVTLESVDEALVSAPTRTEIDREVCSRLTEVYRAAWVTDVEPDRDRLTVRAHAGESPDRFEGSASTELLRRARQTGKTLVAPDEPGPASDREGRGLLAATPLAHSETTYGVLAVRAGSQGAFDRPERTALDALGRRVAFAITATERKLLLLGGQVLEVRFQYSDGAATLAGLSATLDCSLHLDGVVPGEGGSLVCFLGLRETSAERALEAAADADGVDDVRLLRRHDDGGLLEVVLDADSPLLALAQRGGTITGLRVENGVATLTCELAPDTDVRAVHDDLGRQYPSLSLASKRERQAAQQPRSLRETLDDRLTDKQRAVLQGAYYAGYFEWPRGSTAEDLAESIGVSAPTLHNHLRKAQQKLLNSLFEEG